MTEDYDFFDIEKEQRRAAQRRRALGDEAKKIFEDCFEGPTGQRALDILKFVFRAEDGVLGDSCDPHETLKRDTMKKCYWFIDGLARKGPEKREIT